LKEQRELVHWRWAAELVATLADAVQHAHGRGILHRDLKPANILLQPNEEITGGDMVGLSNCRPKITDFGLAKFLLDGEQEPTRTGTVLGTAAYMAPEQASGQSRQVGRPADIYALGVILYELLTGRPPFQADSMLEPLEQVRTHEPVPPRRLRPRLPRDLETVCLKCLEKEPRRRYPTAAALGDDLRRYMSDRPVMAQRTGWTGRLWRWGK